MSDNQSAERVFLSLKIERETHEALTSLAKRDDESRSAMIRRILRSYVSRIAAMEARHG